MTHQNNNLRTAQESSAAIRDSHNTEYLVPAPRAYTLTKPEQVDLLTFESAVLERASRILEKRLRRKGHALGSPDDTRRYLTLKLAHLEHEVFAVLLLDTRNRVINFIEMFHGTIDSASVHPREVVKACLYNNAAALIIAHNHPSGVSEPSNADSALTRRLREAVELVDVRLLDHFVIAGDEYVSFAERGWL